ncbi:protein RICE SALT SENSITIVE 3-like [Zingiber officinale]|uniref:protein RICE SALT SENSITIVE 3-like n=1 Tax=Zingiber officinale TaxID=94328 RepID=UPI001C4C74D8|nr:protein RICE SALT SENSITIVE 3-like [Zingiber officinale]
MEEQLNPLAVTHLLQHTLRSLCISKSSQWIYAVFWRILPRNYPPPKWDLQAGVYDRSRGNRRNWILAWEDGFCNFATNSTTCDQLAAGTSSAYEECETSKGLQPELFFKMSHEIYNYGEGFIGKVAADHGHKWVLKEPQDQEINFLSSWNNSADAQPRTWEAQFQSGIKTIALVAVSEGIVQLGSINKVMEDLSFVALLRKKFSYLESIPGVLLPHPSSAAAAAAAFPIVDGCNQLAAACAPHWTASLPLPLPLPDLYDQYLMAQQMRVTPSMSSLEALLSKLPPVAPPPVAPPPGFMEMPPPMAGLMQRPLVGAKEEQGEEKMEELQPTPPQPESGGESSSSLPSYYLNMTKLPGQDHDPEGF